MLHVNAETGNDSTGDGSLAAPLQRLNTALQKAWDSLHSTSLPDVAAIWVHASAVPVAPSPLTTFGGHEDIGWKENPSDPDPPPFPIRLIAGVDLVGVPQGDDKPKITIDESLPGPTYSDWDPGIPRCLVLADDIQGVVSMSTFKLDGVPLSFTQPPNGNWPGLLVLDSSIVFLSDCEIVDFFNNVYTDVASSKTLRLTLSSCVLADAGPLATTNPSAGHASLWQVGAGASVITAQNTTFRSSHDAVEIVGQGASSKSFTATGCRFEDNENGLEVVGDGGTTTLAVNSSLFLRSHNITELLDGTDESTGAIIVRTSGTSVVNATIRECDFRDSGFGVMWDAPAGSLNLGTAQSPGRNNFCLDFSEFVIFPTPSATAYPSSDPYRVSLYNRTTQTVMAVGNWWYRNNQGADSSGVMTIGLIQASPGAVNLYGTDPISDVTLNPPAPPGPFWGEYETTSLRWLRNFSIASGGAIDFGDETTGPVGSPPDCAVTP